MFLLLFLVIGAYLLGSISSAILVCKLMGLPDPRTTGSNNPGATNVLRIGGKKAAAFVLLGDAAKGFLPVLVARLLGCDELHQVLVLFSAFIGHLFPLFFQFQGGKGVATTLGGLIAFSCSLAAAWTVTWLVIAALFRYSSLSALIATCLLPFYAWALSQPASVSAMLGVLSLILLYRHKSNIKKLWLGQEKKLGQ